MGASMGGHGAWQLAMSKPEWFAAVAPICGGGMYWNAERLRHTSAWVFYGAEGDVVACDESKKMVNAVNQCAGQAKLTIYEDCAHNAWTKTFQNHAMWEWLLKQKNQTIV